MKMMCMTPIKGKRKHNRLMSKRRNGEGGWGMRGEVFLSYRVILLWCSRGGVWGFGKLFIV